MDQKAWHEWRRCGIGSSDAAVIMGVSPWKTRLQLYNEKVNGIYKEKENSAMSYGKEMEPKIRNHIEEKTGLLLEPRNVEHSEISWIKASIDAFSIDGSIFFEIKCANAEDHSMALRGEIPAKYIPQCHHQLLATQMDKMCYVSYHKDSYAFVQVDRNSYTDFLFEEESKFWHENIMKKVPPEPTEKDTVDRMDPNFLLAAQEFAKCRRILQQAEEMEKEARKKLIALTPEYNAEGGGVKITCIPQQGRIDYEKVMQFIFDKYGLMIDLDAFRSPSTVNYRINIIEA